LTKPKQPDRTALLEEAKLQEALAKRRRFFALDFYKPYTKQKLFHDFGATKHERALIAANRSGKTWCAGAEVAMHLSGLYPKWWEGRRFAEPTRWWAAGMTGLAVRDVCQKVLFGTPNVLDDRGTGMVPKSSVNWDKGTTLAHGYAGLYDTVQVKHKSGGTSTVRFMTYEQGREKWQGETLDGVWCDEEPPIALYSEGLTRLATTGGIMLCTFTPLMGRTKVVHRYLSEPSDDRAYVGMTIDDAEHIRPEERERIVAGYLSHERAARARGEPMMGSGRIFEVDEEDLKEPSVNPVPAHWFKLWAIDIGTEHPFAAVLLAHDRDADVVHVLHAFKMRESRPIDHASAMKPWGKEIPVAWPHDGHIRERGSVEPVMRLYKDAGLKTLPSHAAFPDGTISTEAGIRVMDDRMRSGRFKVASHLSEWFEEYRHYHRIPKNDGSSEIVKQNDDLLSATRIGCMTIRSARRGAVGQEQRQGSDVCRDVDFDVLSCAA
jgi:phage terminase large subunit-like protein